MTDIWGGSLGGEATNDSRFNAIWWADALGKLIEDGTSIVARFDLQSSDEPALEEGTLELPGRSVTLLVFGGAAEQGCPSARPICGAFRVEAGGRHRPSSQGSDLAACVQRARGR